MKVWKMAHSHLSEDKYNDAITEGVVCLGKDTEKGQVPKFINADVGDLFYLVSTKNPREISLIGMFIDKNILDANHLRENYMGRRYILLLQAKNKNINIEGASHWMPSGQSTFYKITKDNYDDFETSVLKYNFDITMNEIMELRNEKMLSMKINKKIKLLKDRMQIILQGPPGTGKTRVAKQMAISMINDSLPLEKEDEIKKSFKEVEDAGQVKLIQFHPSYRYEDFVRGIVAKPSDDGNGIKYETENKVLAEMANDAKDNTDKNYILIIDEINRANLSSVLGELIYALEYRGESVESMYKHPKDGRKIVLPENLYIIGTMNTADRSIGHIDYALRRRFTFVDVPPEEDVVSNKILFNRVKALFVNDDGKRADTLSMEFNPNDVMLGHSYFIGDEDQLRSKLEYQVKPLLREYVKDGVLQESSKDKIEEL